MEKTNKPIADKIKIWRQCLRSAMIKGDLGYAMHCDKMIVKLKKEQDV